MHRVVFASGGNGLLPDDLRCWLCDQLTFFERRFDFVNTNSNGNAQLELIERKLYEVDPNTGAIVFGLGMLPRIRSLLTQLGHKVVCQGGTLRQLHAREYPNAAYTDFDGMLLEYTPFPDQVTCLSKILASDGGVISATTGYGKSTMMRMLCRLYAKAKIHIVTKAKTLALEIYQDLIQKFPDVGFIGNNKRSFGRITVVMADSIHHGQGDADIVLADEGHELAAPKYTGKLGTYTRARMFTFSASPKGRSDNRDVCLEAVFGPQIHTMSYQEAQALGRVVPITVEWLHVAEGPGVDHLQFPTAREEIGIWQNETRNRIIADRARKFGPDEQVMIMVKTIDHAVHLKSFLPDYTLAYAGNGMDPARLKRYVKRGLLRPDEPLMTSKRINQLRQDFADQKIKKVIANYVWSTGVNFRYLTGLIRADAAGSTIRDTQIPGRACRRVAGVKESAILVDCADEWCQRYYQKALNRRKNYEEKGWTQTWFNQEA